MTITIHNKHWSIIPTSAVYIGRGSSVGNDYSHLPKTKAKYKVGTRAEAIECYRNDLYENLKLPKFKAEIKKMYEIWKTTGDLHLVCYCAPHGCHGDVIKDLLINATGDEEWLK